MSFHCTCSNLLVCALAMSAPFAGVAEAGIAYSELKGAVHASIDSVGQPPVADTQSVQMADFEPLPLQLEGLTKRLKASVGGTPPATSAGSQSIFSATPSVLGHNSVLGAVSVDPTGGAKASGAFTGSFTIDQAYTFEPTLESLPSQPVTGNVSGSILAQLIDEQGQTLFDAQNLPVIADTYSTVRLAPFDLPAGTYSFALASEITAEGEDAYLWGEYSFYFKLTPVDRDPAAVPLPPAVWMGMVTLAGVGIGQYRRVRQRE